MTESVVPCDEASATLLPIPPNIILVLDKSGSMVWDSNRWDHDDDCGGLCEDLPDYPDPPYCGDAGASGCETRWFSLYEVVEFVVGSFDDKVNLGLVLFPIRDASGANDACDVASAPDVPVGPTSGAAILTAIPPKSATDDDVYGGTPSSAGLSLAYEDLTAQVGDNAPAVVFVTDGVANCYGSGPVFEQWETYDADLLPVITDAWQDDEIPTYVVGIDIENEETPSGDPQDDLDGIPNGINPYDKLDELANAGGKPNPSGPPAFYQTTNQVQLEAALQQIVDDSMGCVVELDPLPPFPDMIEVFVGGVEVPEITDCATEHGWMYVPPTPPYDHIELCGTACSDLKVAGEVHIDYYCEPG
jgi:hypothetical protein